MSLVEVVRKSWDGSEVKIKGRKVIGKSIYEIGLIVEAQARELAPKKTGRLRGSITTQAIDKGSSPIVVDGSQGTDVISKPPVGEVHVGTNVEYAAYMEYGTSRTDAQPFLRPSLALAQGKWLTIVENNGRAEFREYIK